MPYSPLSHRSKATYTNSNQQHDHLPVFRKTCIPQHYRRFLSVSQLNTTRIGRKVAYLGMSRQLLSEAIRIGADVFRPYQAVRARTNQYLLLFPLGHQAPPLLDDDDDAEDSQDHPLHDFRCCSQIHARASLHR